MTKFCKVRIGEYYILLIGDNQGLMQLKVLNYNSDISEIENFVEDSDFFENEISQLSDYFAGKLKDFKIKFNLKGTEFQKKVWQALLEIPYGEMYSYKRVAVNIGNPKASRAVGNANNKNPIPIIIPCHRVVGSSNKLGGYAYGIEMKKDLINLEKISVINSL